MTALALVLLTAFFFRRDDANKPRFVPASSQNFSGSVEWVSYPFLVPRPFENGKMWVSCKAGNRYHTFLFDIEKRATKGELLHADPAFMTADQSKLVCTQRMPSDIDSPMEMMARLFARLTGHPVPQANAVETFWLLDLKKNSAKRLGTVTQSAGASSSLVPSPGFERAFIKPTSTIEKQGFYVCDLHAIALQKIKLDLVPEGWWDSNTIVAQTKDCDHVLFDVVQKTTSPFLSQSQIAGALTEARLTDDPAAARLFFSWNGKEYAPYLTDAHKRWLATNSFLFEMQRPAMTLKLVSQDFQFGWLDQFSPSQTHYIYTGRDSGKGSSAVYLRDLAANSDTTLVPDDGSSQFSLPRFRGNQVIFVRSNALYQVDLTGSNVTKLFPPEPKQ